MSELQREPTFWVKQPEYDPEQDGYKYVKDAAGIFCFMCEECATHWAAYWANTNLARQDFQKQWRQGFMRAWREVHATFENKWPYV